MPYILNTPSQIKEMLEVVGLHSLEELFSHLPPSLRIRGELSLPSGLSEEELIRVVKRLAKKNKPLSKFNSFLGGGIYPHYIPSPLNHLIGRAEFYTAYTPYQAEASQGSLQAIFEYQTYICLLTGMEVSNASLYDGATSLAEAVLMSLRIKRRSKVLICESIHPEYRAVLHTYLKGSDFLVEEIKFNRDGFLDLDTLKEKIDDRVACVCIQSPNFFGLIEDLETINEIVKKKGILVILVTNPVSLAILKEPAKLGADIVCGEGQVLGRACAWGGETFGWLATKRDYLRHLPGRIVGKTVDREGKESFCLTLQTREQHIRREKATSNICSNHSLNAIAGAIYLSLLGKEGLKKVALYSLNLAYYLYRCLEDIKEIKLVFPSPFFNEFVWQVNNSYQVWEALYSKSIIPGLMLEKFYPQLKDCILTSCTEIKTKEEIDDFVMCLKEVVR